MNRFQLVLPTAAMSFALLMSGCTNSADDADLNGAAGETASASPSPSSTSPAEAAALAVVMEAYAAFNSGDGLRWAEMRSAGSNFTSEENRNEDIAAAAQNVKERAAAGKQFTHISCKSHGEGEWPGIADAGLPTAEGYYFTCEHNDGAKGFVTYWVIADGKVVAASSP